MSAGYVPLGNLHNNKIVLYALYDYKKTRFSHESSSEKIGGICSRHVAQHWQVALKDLARRRYAKRGRSPAVDRALIDQQPRHRAPEESGHESFKAPGSILEC